MVRCHKQNVIGLAFSLNGQLLATASDDQTVKLWNPRTLDEITSFKGALLAFVSVAFSHDGSRLAAGTFEGTVKVWDLASRQEVLTLKGHSTPVYGVAFGRDATTLISASLDAVMVWRAPSFTEIDAEEKVKARRE